MFAVIFKFSDYVTTRSEVHGFKCLSNPKRPLNLNLLFYLHEWMYEQIYTLLMYTDSRNRTHVNDFGDRCFATKLYLQMVK